MPNFPTASKSPKIVRRELADEAVFNSGKLFGIPLDSTAEVLRMIKEMNFFVQRDADVRVLGQHG